MNLHIFYEIDLDFEKIKKRTKRLCQSQHHVIPKKYAGILATGELSVFYLSKTYRTQPQRDDIVKHPSFLDWRSLGVRRHFSVCGGATDCRRRNLVLTTPPPTQQVGYFNIEMCHAKKLKKFRLDSLTPQ